MDSGLRQNDDSFEKMEQYGQVLTLSRYSELAIRSLAQREG
jgi:hypothetical protein